MLGRSHDLEEEIYGFMEISANPTIFPSKEDLIVAGREDLVRAIAKKRGWMAYGWDSDDENEVNIDNISYGAEKTLYARESRIFQHKIASVTGEADSSSEADSSNILAIWDDSMVSSSGSPMWRTWRMQKSGNPLTNFEAAEIVFEEHVCSEIEVVSHLLIGKDIENASVVRLVADASSKLNCPYDNDYGSLKNEISLQLQHLELQLTSALQLFKCRKIAAYSCKDENHESLLEVLHKLFDALEFQQNEIKKARDILRSTKAKLTVIEGEIALDVFVSRKSIEEKWKRLPAVEKIVSMLRCVWIVWPHSASEVLLAGSFDGWTSQRKMEKKNPSDGVFSLWLKLYPGRYEIKFIVDGVWTIDPLHPVDNSNGFQNNLLIVT